MGCLLTSVLQMGVNTSNSMKKAGFLMVSASEDFFACGGGVDSVMLDWERKSKKISCTWGIFA